MDLQLGLFADEPTPPVRGPVEAAPGAQQYNGVAERLPDGVRLGTSSWSFPGWEGIVYDRPASPAVLARDGLAAYARHPLLRTVGVDRTYYRPISAEAFGALAESVPGDFRFLVKADRLLTSPVDPDARGVRGHNPLFLDERHALREVVGPMRDGLSSKAGPLLFQFSPIPPNLVGGVAGFLERLRRFLGSLPEGPLYAVELRTPGFLTEEYVSILEDTGVTHCYTIHPAMSSLEQQFAAVQPYQQRAFIARWMLHAGIGYDAAKERYAPFDRIVDEDVDSREQLAIAALDAAIAERGVFIIANNKAEGSAPLSILRLAERIAGWEQADEPSLGESARS